MANTGVPDRTEEDNYIGESKMWKKYHILGKLHHGGGWWRERTSHIFGFGYIPQSLTNLVISCLMFDFVFKGFQQTNLSRLHVEHLT